MHNVLARLSSTGLRSRRGQGLTEYALVIALISIVAVAALILLGGQISTIFGDITTTLGG
jgi:pilus assembly protein Flp/PilA